MNQGTLKHLYGAVFMVVGSTIVLGSVVLMNEFSQPPEKQDVGASTTIEIAQPTPKPKPKVTRPKPKPKPKTNTPPPPSLAALTSGMSGIAVDIPGLDFQDLGAANSDLLSGSGDVVHTSDTVDNAPQPVQQSPMQYPRRLRDQGVEGYVVLSLLINKVGGIERIKVIESKPPGAFDDAAKAGIRQWKFQAGTYQGEPVKVWVRQKIRFDLKR